MQNDGTNKLLLKLLLFKGKIIESQLPDEEELLKGVSIIEQYIRIINPIDLSESEIELLRQLKSYIQESQKYPDIEKAFREMFSEICMEWKNGFTFAAEKGYKAKQIH